MERSASAIWHGDLKQGTGSLTTQSHVLNDTTYSFHTRFEEAAGTNPEELIAAAHAGCFTMALSSQLTSADREGHVRRARQESQRRLPSLAPPEGRRNHPRSHPHLNHPSLPLPEPANRRAFHFSTPYYFFSTTFFPAQPNRSAIPLSNLANGQCGARRDSANPRR